MREIKFRAWVGTHNLMFQVREMIIPDGLNEAGMQEIAATDNYSIVRPMHYIQPILMQYTGLKDKNGKEIYEGDIVKHPLCVKEPHDINEPCETFIGRIQFEVDRGQYFAVNMQRNGYVIVMSEAYKFEVIGNIYENPELLK